MLRKRQPSDIQSEEDVAVINPFGYRKLQASKARKYDSLHHPATRRPLPGTSLIDRMKGSNESKSKVSMEQDSTDVVTISDDEDKLDKPNKQDGTGKGKVTLSNQRQSASQISPYYVSSTDKSILDNKPILRNAKTVISSLPQKSRLLNNDTPSLRNPMRPTSSSSTYSLRSESIENASSLSPAKHNIPSPISFLDDRHHSDDDSYQSLFDNPISQLLSKECLSNTSPIRQSSPIQQPQISTRMEHLDIAPSSSNPSSNNLFANHNIKDREWGRNMEPADGCHGMINNKDAIDGNSVTNTMKLDNDNELDTNIKKGADILFDSDSDDMGFSIKKDTNGRNTRINNSELDINTEKASDDRIDEYDDIELEINNNKSSKINRIHSPPHDKSKNDGQDSTKLFIPRRSARQRAKPKAPLYDDQIENDIFDFDDLPTNSGPSRKYKKRGTRNSMSPALVELSDGEMAEQNDTVLFTYPVDRSKGSVTITASDQSRLEPSQYLNDSVIDFYLKWLMDSYSGANGHDVPSAIAQRTADDTHIFSTHFYNRLTQGSGRSISYENVRKWTSDIDLFNKKYVIFPINENWHWYLVLVYNVYRCVSGTRDLSSHSEMDDDSVDSGKPLIFILDSLGGRKRKCVKDLTAYLTMEAESRRGIESSEFIAPKFESANVPKQNNTCDCGVFLLHFVDQFLNSPQNFIDTLLVQDARHEIWKKDEIEQKRSELRKLFTEVQHQYSVVNNG